MAAFRNDGADKMTVSEKTAMLETLAREAESAAQLYSRSGS